MQSRVFADPMFSPNHWNSDMRNIIDVVGAIGSHKTTLLKEVRDSLKESGDEFLRVSPIFSIEDEEFLGKFVTPLLARIYDAQDDDFLISAEKELLCEKVFVALHSVPIIFYTLHSTPLVRDSTIFQGPLDKSDICKLIDVAHKNDKVDFLRENFESHNGVNAAAWIEIHKMLVELDLYSLWTQDELKQFFLLCKRWTTRMESLPKNKPTCLITEGGLSATLVFTLRHLMISKGYEEADATNGFAKLFLQIINRMVTSMYNDVSSENDEDGLRGTTYGYKLRTLLESGSRDVNYFVLHNTANLKECITDILHRGRACELTDDKSAVKPRLEQINADTAAIYGSLFPPTQYDTKTMLLMFCKAQFYPSTHAYLPNILENALQKMLMSYLHLTSRYNSAYLAEYLTHASITCKLGTFVIREYGKPSEGHLARSLLAILCSKEIFSSAGLGLLPKSTVSFLRQLYEVYSVETYQVNPLPPIESFLEPVPSSTSTTSVRPVSYFFDSDLSDTNRILVERKTLDHFFLNGAEEWFSAVRLANARSLLTIDYKIFPILCFLEAIMSPTIFIGCDGVIYSLE